MIAIIDYGMGNIHSVNKALEVYGAKTIVTNKPEDIRACEKAVLPGVGAFDDAMQELDKQGLIPVLMEHIKNKKPFLGICLGMQLLFEGSEEARSTKGLGIFKGMVRKFEAKKDLKVPHMGWNQLKKSQIPNPKSQIECPLLKDVPDGAFVYFCHSYYPDPKDKEIIAASCNYGKDFVCAVAGDNVYGVQFHPEKSQAIGLKMLENFVKLC
jgi:glutamine amidotransferase